MTSIFNALLIKLQNKLMASIPYSTDDRTGIRYVDQDLGQIDNYKMKPSISMPAVLVDFTNTTYDQKQMKAQWAQMNISLRLVFDPYSFSNSLTDQQYREMALIYYETEGRIYLSLQDWNADGLLMLPLKRISAATERREDDRLRVRNITFKATYEDKTLQQGAIIIPPINPVTTRLEWTATGGQNFVFSERLKGITKEYIQQVSWEGDDKFFVITEGLPTDKQVLLDNVQGRLIFLNDQDAGANVWCQILNN